MWVGIRRRGKVKKVKMGSISISRGVLVKGYAAAIASPMRSFSISSSLQPPDLSRLAKTAQISLTPNEVQQCAPKIQQVIHWFGQLQGIDLQSIEPSIRAETENNLRDNAPETFDNRDAMVAAVPSYEKPYIKVPKVLSVD